MGARNQKGEGSWDLAVAIYAIVVLSAATDLAGFQRFAPSLGLPAWVGAFCMVPIKLIEWRCLTFTSRLFRSGWLGKFACPVFVVAWFLAVGLSALAAYSTFYTTLAFAERAGAKKAETRINLTTIFDGVKAQLGLLSKPLPRPVKVVEQAVAWIALPESVRHTTRDCTRFQNDNLRDPARTCAKNW